jgi:Ca2+/Na+ antiporter
MTEAISMKGVFYGLMFWVIYLIGGLIHAIRLKNSNHSASLEFSGYFMAGGFFFLLIVSLFSNVYFGLSILAVLMVFIFSYSAPKADAEDVSSENEEPEVANIKPRKKFVKYTKKKAAN